MISSGRSSPTAIINDAVLARPESALTASTPNERDTSTTGSAGSKGGRLTRSWIFVRCERGWPKDPNGAREYANLDREYVGASSWNDLLTGLFSSRPASATRESPVPQARSGTRQCFFLSTLQRELEVESEFFLREKGAVGKTHEVQNQRFECVTRVPRIVLEIAAEA